MKEKGFTLIELLAVIIILGVLMLIAIPSVTSYINDSRKSTYVSTVQEMIKAASTKVNSGELDIYDTNTTYYIPVDALELENGKAKSPYGDFEEAYIVVTTDGDEFDYYFVGKDTVDNGIEKITSSEALSKEKITTSITEISTDVGVGNRNNIVVFNDDLTIKENKSANSRINGGSSDINASPICIRAGRLHEEICNHYHTDTDKLGCAAIYKKGDTVTFGNSSTTSGQLVSGDPFDCDVNGDGIYDSEKERFYYVSDYYDTHTKSFDEDTATLIFYSNTKNGVIDYNGAAYASPADAQEVNQYASTRYNNWLGPVTAVKHLPSTTGTNAWRSDLLKTNSRAILAEGEGYHSINNVFNNGTVVNLPTNFSYEGKAARLITAQEVMSACGITEFTGLSVSNGEINGCNYLMEGTEYTYGHMVDEKTSGIYLETADPEFDTMVWMLMGDQTGMMTNCAVREYTSYYQGIKPTIDIPKNRIEY